MSGEHTHSHDSQGSALDSQAVVPLKRNCSSEQEESAKRHQQDPKRSAESRLEVAKEMFRQAGGQQLHTIVDRLLNENAPSKVIEAAYSPFFKKLALAIVARDDIPIPPAAKYAGHFLASDPTLRESAIKFFIRSVIDY
ncbi:hypothetical protein C0992_013218, partial [Termitomyces sp. T32_za158]